MPAKMTAASVSDQGFATRLGAAEGSESGGGSNGFLCSSSSGMSAVRDLDFEVHRG